MLGLVFFGGYVGGIIGGLVAFFVARFQINEQFNKQIANEEINKFISQMPAVIKLRYELDNMRESLVAVSENIERKKLNNFDVAKWIVEDTEMYSLSEQNWLALDQIDSADLSVSLLSLKFKYMQVYDVFTYNFLKFDAMKSKIEEESLNSTDYEKMYQADKIGIEMEKKYKFKMECVKHDALEVLIDDIEEIQGIIKIVLESIEDEKNKRHIIRDSVL